MVNLFIFAKWPFHLYASLYISNFISSKVASLRPTTTINFRPSIDFFYWIFNGKIVIAGPKYYRCLGGSTSVIFIINHSAMLLLRIMMKRNENINSWTWIWIERRYLKKKARVWLDPTFKGELNTEISFHQSEEWWRNV